MVKKPILHLLAFGVRSPVSALTPLRTTRQSTLVDKQAGEAQADDSTHTFDHSRQRNPVASFIKLENIAGVIT